MRTELLSVVGSEIEYRIVGERRPDARDLVVLHEGLGSVSMWKDFPDALAEATGYRAIVYSRHGYGRSSTLRQRRGPEFMHEEANVVLPALLEALGIERPVLFGHSDGASIALIHAASPGATVAGVIALAPHVKVEALSITSIEQARLAYETTDLRARLARYHRDVDSAFWGWNQIWLDPAFRDWNIERMLPAIGCPVLAVQGRNDEYGTLEQIESIRRALPSTELLVLEECGHSPHRDQPAAVLAATQRFLARLAAPN